MALKKLSLLDLHVAIKNRIESGTNLLVMDHIEPNTPAPFAYLEIIGQIERNTKTMFVDRFTIHVHVISAPERGSKTHYENINNVQEALTEYIGLPEEFTVFGQTSSGLISNFTQPDTNERHAVLAFVFDISYGFKIKL